MSGLATRLYKGEAGLDVIGRRKLWFTIAATALLIAALSFGLRGFTLGIDFTGGNKFQIPADTGSVTQVESNFNSLLAGVNAHAKAGPAQLLGGGEGTYEIKTSPLTPEESFQFKSQLAENLGIAPSKISETQVSGAWGSQVTEKALLGLAIFLALVIGYLIVRFEWRMAVAAVASLLLNLGVTAAVYALVGFEVTPSTVVGFLTILGFALYDVVVVFDKVQENTHNILSRNTQSYSEAANLAVNQTLMRSINTGLVALLPVGGLLFIGAGLLGAGTLKDLGLVLFIGMGAAVYSSIFFATPVLVALKNKEARIVAHTARVMSKRSNQGRDENAAVPNPRQLAETPAMAGAGAPRAGQRPSRQRRR